MTTFNEALDALAMSDADIARELEVSPTTVWRWRTRGRAAKVVWLALEALLERRCISVLSEAARLRARPHDERVVQVVPRAEDEA